MRILGLILCLGLLPVPSAAKLKVGIDVDAPDDRIKSELKAGLAARFNSTDRYTVTESATETDIILQMICIPVKMKGASYNLGVACSTEGFYYPFKHIALAHHLPGAGSLVTDHSENLQSIIDSSANDLINATTDEKLSEYKKLMTDQVQLVCLSEPGICRLSPPQK